MTALTEVFVTVRPDVDKFGPEVSKKLARIDSAKSGKMFATRFGVGMNGAIGGIVSKSAGLFAAGFAAVQGVKVFGSFINDARESEKVSRITANAIKATGGAARISADQVGELATSISNKTAIDDEQVQTAANMLLTFKNIRNEAGKGNDVFNQATQAAADLSVQFGGIDGASKQLGKALNDPIKGTTALAKAGVTFTDQQKKQIATLVKSGDVLGAQKIILKEIEGQVGGAAAAAADPIEKLKVVAGNLAEEVGGFLLPSVNKFSDFATGTLIPGVKGLFSAFQGEGVTSDGFVGFMERIGVAARGAFDYFKSDVLPRLKEFGGFVGSEVVPKLQQFAGFITGTVVPAIGNLIGSVKPLAQDVGGAVVGGFQKLLPLLQQAGQFIAGTIVPAVVDFTKWLKDNSTVVGAVAVGVGAMVIAFKGYQLALTIGAAATKAYAVVQGILNAVMSANPIGIVVLALVGLAAGLTYAYKKSETFRGIVNGVFNGVKTVAQAVFGAVTGFVKGSIDWITTNFPKLLQILMYPFTKGQELIGAAWTGIKNGAQSALRFIVDKVLAFAQSILDGAGKAFGWVPGLGDKLKVAATEFGKFRDDVNRKLGGITDQQIDLSIKYTNTGVNISTPSSVGRKATGGPIHGPGTGTSDTAGLYALSNGEHVWTAKEVAAVGGHGVMENMRKSVASGAGFAKGGAVGLNPNLIANASGLANSVKAVVVAAASSAAKALAKAGGGLAGTMAFGRSQAGKPYVWGGSGPSGYDCSGFVSALINYSRGRNPYSRLGATGSMPWSDMTSGTGRFMVGWFKGNPGHTAATINGVNFESRGGRGVVTGSGARGAYDGLFTNRAKVKGFAKGGAVQGDLPYDVLNPRGKAFEGKSVLRELGIGSYANGSFRIMRDQLALIHKGEMVIPKQAANPLRSILTSKLHQLHQTHVAHQKHQAHVAHEAHVNTTRLHPDDMRHLGRIVADELRSNPPRVHLDGRAVDTAMSRSALNRGY